MSYYKRTITLVTMMLFTSVTHSAGDYIWEGKFKKELPKAEQGDPGAQYAVGEMYEKGKGAVKDIGKAFDWYLKAAKQNNTKAAYRVGLFYYEGNVVKLDYDEALSWFTKSAEHDYFRAQYHLGEMYEYGRGVTKNYETALTWYNHALEGGYNPAADSIERVTRAQKKKTSFLKRPKSPPRNSVSTLKKVLKGGWTKRKQSAEYLPSGLTKCAAKDRKIECLSKDITRSIGMADITYTTKAILFSFTGDNLFKISYRNNVSKINVTDEEFIESGGKIPVKLGWQDAEHTLSCELENDKTINCTKNKLRKVTFSRK